MRTALLDSGYVELIETWGSDERIVEAARMSTDKGFQGWGKREQCEYCGASQEEVRNTPAWMECSTSGAAHKFGSYGPPGDEKLLRYLYTHKHMTPFEMAGMTIEVQAPIFVFREWHRHRTQSYNELSARYTELPDLFYMPSEDRIMHGKQSTSNKQSSGVFPAEFHEKTEIMSLLHGTMSDARQAYESLLKLGVAREIARLIIPVAQYSRMRASANLRNWLGFLTLRMDEGAQWEIRQYANAVADVVKDKFPRTYELFAEGAK